MKKFFYLLIFIAICSCDSVRNQNDYCISNQWCTDLNVPWNSLKGLEIPSISKIVNYKDKELYLIGQQMGLLSMDIKTKSWKGLDNNSSGGWINTAAFKDMYLKDDKLYIGGGFNINIDGKGAQHGVIFDLKNKIWKNWANFDRETSAIIGNDLNNDIVIGGDFTKIDDKPFQSIALYSNGNWTELGKGIRLDTDKTKMPYDRISDIAIYNKNGKYIIYVVGVFNEVKNSDGSIVSVNNIAQFDVFTNKWSSISDKFIGVRKSITFAKVIGDKLFISGEGLEINNTRLGIYNILTDNWDFSNSSINTDVTDAVISEDKQMIYLASKNEVFIYKPVTGIVEPKRIDRVVTLDNNTGIRALERYGKYLYLGGDFHEIDGRSVSQFAMYQITN
jgi:hypothetical protein